MHRLVPALEQARTTTGRKAKVTAIAEGLRAIAEDGDDDELATAARIVSGQALPTRDGLVVGVGGAFVFAAACEAYGLSAAELGAATRRLGNLGDAVGELAAKVAAPADRPGLNVAELAGVARSLATVSDRDAKMKLLCDAYGRARPPDAKYLTKVLLGELRIGVRAGILEEAIAAAFERSPKEVRAAALLCPDPGELALLARDDELSRAALVVGSPIAFMLASPIETVKSEIVPARTVWEDKLDGVRVQLHAEGPSVRLFARGGGEVTAVFPEIARGFREPPRALILDGEILAVSAPSDAGGAPRPRPFQALQSRLNRRDPDAEVIAATTVMLFAFDLLFDGEPILELPWSTRRERLAALFAGDRFAAVARATEPHPLDPDRPVGAQVDDAYAAARARGHEGVVLKDRDAPYEAGRRGSAWRKVKRAVATLDVVITRAELGHGKRASVLSDYTFGVWEGEALVEIGKAYSGLTDAEIRDLTGELESITREVVGRYRMVEPRIVLEVAFDGIQPSKRHASGFALRFPRIVRIRTDKRPPEADTLATARALFDAQVATGHREEEAARPRASPVRPGRKGKRPTAPTGQLGLFDERLDEKAK